MKKQLPYSIRKAKPSEINDSQEWFGTSSDKIEQEESPKQYTIKGIKQMMSEIRNKQFNNQ